MKAFSILALGLWTLTSVTEIFTQGVTIGASNAPHPSAALDIQSIQGGLLPPRLTTAQRNAIVNPANGLLIYNSEVHCAQMYLPQAGWRNLLCDCSSVPNATFSGASSATEQVPVSFSATGNGLTYQWSFSGGNPVASTLQNPTVTWNTAGTYSISLTVTDGLGCSATTTQNITVQACPTLGSNTASFAFTGSLQTWTVPPGVCTIQIETWGAQGGSTTQAQGGLGGYARGTLQVTTGQVLNLYVGGQGGNPTGGWNGGGNGHNNGGYPASGGGGGASDARLGGTGLSNRILVAGGGGGAVTLYSGSYNVTTPGAGGGLTGTDAGTVNNSSASATGGQGGTSSAGGNGGTGSANGNPGTSGQGGNAFPGTDSMGGGGGGGFFGGGGGGYQSSGINIASSGGGGSGYIGGVLNGVFQTGVRNGNGQIVITY